MKYVKKVWIGIVIASVIAALAVLGITRLLAPQLLGLPLDLQMVQVSDKVVPFFDVALNEEEIRGKIKYIKDPYFKHRRRPLTWEGKAGPIDLLGFRNHSVPTRPRIITIGDSQTFGLGVIHQNNWPSCMARGMHLPMRDIYNMSVSGWGAVEYFEIAKKALLFKPRVLIIAFYTGNDPLDSSLRAYADKRWKTLRSKDLPDKITRPPKVHYPPKKKEQWTVRFSDGVKTVMTPHLRYASNSDHLAVRAGYAVMAEVAARITEMAKKTKTKTVFTFIPTKELAFAVKVAGDKIKQDKTYAKLIKSEPERMAALRERIQKIPGASFVDVASPLQQAIKGSNRVYYRATGGHPKPAGYQVIADTLKPVVQKFLN